MEKKQTKLAKLKYYMKKYGPTGIYNRIKGIKNNFFGPGLVQEKLEQLYRIEKNLAAEFCIPKMRSLGL